MQAGSPCTHQTRSGRDLPRWLLALGRGASPGSWSSPVSGRNSGSTAGEHGNREIPPADCTNREGRAEGAKATGEGGVRKVMPRGKKGTHFRMVQSSGPG